MRPGHSFKSVEWFHKSSNWRFESLDLSSNNISGIIPDDELSHLSRLQYLSILNLSHNKLSGPCPTQLSNLHALEQLFLSHNYLNGSIPKVISVLWLITIDLSHNMLSGKIPFELGNMSSLNYLDLSYNKLTSNIPTNLLDRKSVV